VNAYVHALSADRDALFDFLEDAESSFLELGIAPDVDRPTTVPAETAREHARVRPTATSADGWLPYLAPAALDQLAETERVHYAGIAGMTVTARVLRETTGPHPDVVLQSHTYTGTPMEYTVYRYDGVAGEFSQVAAGDYA
jgi:hypothetical protein